MRKSDVKSFIENEAKSPFEWGVTDCAATADRWVNAVSGISPMRTYGRMHQTRDEAVAWMNEPGGIVVAYNRIMRAAGFKKTKSPVAGDIGLIVNPDRRACVAIFSGDEWFSRHEDGMIIAPRGAFWKAWSICID